tara:strand:+ start:2090 stop:3070 length:981 start_codon:yes stop_codon:yes gene_type:complete
LTKITSSKRVILKKNITNYCIVGYGNHAKNKLLPVLLRLNKKVFGIVSSKKKVDTSIKIFKKLEQAINKADDKTIFILSSPPEVHFSQIKLLLEYNKNIFVEKPMSIHPQEVNTIIRDTRDKDIFVAEMLMYKYTKQYKHFVKFWDKKKDKCNKIECFFNIPKIPSGTFRNSNDITSSCLYDIGCYLISLLIDLKIYPENFKISKIVKKNKKFLQFIIEASTQKIDVYLEFGFGNEYVNLVKLNYMKNYIASFEKFFYGVEAKKTITLQNTRDLKEITINDINGFEKMFEKSNLYWQKTQKVRFNNLKKVNNILYSLSESLIYNKS